MDHQNLEDAKKAAKKAVQFDGERQYKQALCWYDIAARFLDKSSSNPALTSKSNEYKQRINQLKIGE